MRDKEQAICLIWSPVAIHPEGASGVFWSGTLAGGMHRNIFFLMRWSIHKEMEINPGTAGDVSDQYLAPGIVC